MIENKTVIVPITTAYAEFKYNTIKNKIVSIPVTPATAVTSAPASTLNTARARG